MKKYFILISVGIFIIAGSVILRVFLFPHSTVVYQNGFVAVNLRDADLKGTLEEIGKKSGMRVVVSDGVRHSVTKRFGGLRPYDALKELISNIRPSLIMQSEFDPGSDSPSRIEVSQLRSARPNTFLTKQYESNDTRLEKFSIQYPAYYSSNAQWNSQVDTGDFFHIQFYRPSDFEFFGEGDGAVLVYPNSDHLSLDAWIAKYAFLGQAHEDFISEARTVWESFSVNGYPAYAYFRTQREGALENGITIYFSDGEFVYEILELTIQKPDRIEKSLPFQMATSFRITSLSEGAARVFSPMAGERWETGKTYQVKWTGVGKGKIYLSLIDVAFEQRSASLAQVERFALDNTGTFKYTVPPRFQPGIVKWCFSHLDAVDTGWEACSGDFQIIMPGFSLYYDPVLKVSLPYPHAWNPTAEPARYEGKDGYFYAMARVADGDSLGTIIKSMYGLLTPFGEKPKIVKTPIAGVDEAAVVIAEAGAANVAVLIVRYPTPITIEDTPGDRKTFQFFVLESDKGHIQFFKEHLRFY